MSRDGHLRQCFMERSRLRQFTAEHRPRCIRDELFPAWLAGSIIIGDLPTSLRREWTKSHRKRLSTILPIDSQSPACCEPQRPDRAGNASTHIHAKACVDSKCGRMRGPWLAVQLNMVLKKSLEGANISCSTSTSPTSIESSALSIVTTIYTPS